MEPRFVLRWDLFSISSPCSLRVSLGKGALNFSQPELFMAKDHLDANYFLCRFKRGLSAEIDFNGLTLYVHVPLRASPFHKYSRFPWISLQNTFHLIRNDINQHFLLIWENLSHLLQEKGNSLNNRLYWIVVVKERIQLKLVVHSNLIGFCLTWGAPPWSGGPLDKDLFSDKGRRRVAEDSFNIPKHESILLLIPAEEWKHWKQLKKDADEKMDAIYYVVDEGSFPPFQIWTCWKIALIFCNKSHSHQSTPVNLWANIGIFYKSRKSENGEIEIGLISTTCYCGCYSHHFSSSLLELSIMCHECQDPESSQVCKSHYLLRVGHLFSRHNSGKIPRCCLQAELKPLSLKSQQRSIMAQGSVDFPLRLNKWWQWD